MKKSLGLILGLVISTTLFAGEAVEVSALTGVRSKNVDPDATIFDTGPISFSELTFQGKNGLYLYFRHLSGKEKSARELDTAIGWYQEGKKEESGIKALSIDVGVEYDDFDKLFRGPSGDAYVAFARFSKSYEREYWSITPFVELEHYVPGKGSDFDGGFRGRFGARYSHTLLGFEVKGETALVRDDGTFGYMPAWVVNQSVGLEWKHKNVTVNCLTLTYLGPTSWKPDSGRVRTIVASADISVSF